MNNYAFKSPRRVVEQWRDVTQEPRRTDQATAHYREQALAAGVRGTADELEANMGTTVKRYGPEYGPYAGVRINCPQCGVPIHWTLEEAVTSDYPEPIGFCPACHAIFER